MEPLPFEFPEASDEDGLLDSDFADSDFDESDLADVEAAESDDEDLVSPLELSPEALLSAAADFL